MLSAATSPTLSGLAEAPKGACAGQLTYVELVWYERRIERWIRFGRTVDEEILDRRRRRVGFAPGSVFAFVRWAANDVGTVVSRLDILRAVRPGESCSSVPGVTPGGDLLLRLSGWSKVKRALASIDGIEAFGIDPADVAPDHWRHVHNRIESGQTPRAYSRHRHHAWRLRAELGA